jgi:signal peptidase II
MDDPINHEGSTVQSDVDSIQLDEGLDRYRFILPSVVALFGLAADRWTKILIEDAMQMHHVVPVFGDYVRLVLWYNKGAAFGIRLGSPWVHILLTVCAMGLVGWMLWQTPGRDRLSHIGFGLILGGALGNLYDRAVAGQVTDFIDVGIGVYRWPTFNIADSLVVIGFGLLVISYLLAMRAERRAAKEQTVSSEDVEPASPTE